MLPWRSRPHTLSCCLDNCRWRSFFFSSCGSPVEPTRELITRNGFAAPGHGFGIVLWEDRILRRAPSDPLLLTRRSQKRRQVRRGGKRQRAFASHVEAPSSPLPAGHSCNTTSDFYGLRSGIIHGRRRGNKDPERASQDRKRALQVKTYDIAKATVLEHLKRGHMPGDQQWNEIVMGRVPADRFQKGGR